MERTFIKDIRAHIGEQILIKGFIHAIRDQGSIKFVVIRDITGTVQTVFLKKEKEAFAQISDLNVESVISLEGLVVDIKQAPGGVEIQALSLEVLAKSEPELPIPILAEKGGMDTDVSKRFDWRVLDLRKPEKKQIFKVWTALEKGFRSYFDKNDFYQVYAPSFMSAPSESGAEVFEVNYFDRKAYLAQSPQFYKQMAMSAGFEKVFMTGPVFRAEPSYTTRHMTEFTGWDFEVSFIHSHHEVMDILEQLLVSGFRQVSVDTGLDVKVPDTPFPRLTMEEIKVKLQKEGVVGEKKHDLSPEEERKICEIIKRETGSDFVFVTDYSIEVRPFYHMRYEDKVKTTRSFDLLYKGVEIVTGAQREHRYAVLLEQAKEKGMDTDMLSNYLDFFRFGCPPHGGVGIGPGRIVMGILELPSVKEATFLPRDVKRLTP